MSRNWPGGMRSREPHARRIEKQRAKIARLEERIGYLCSQRADAEEVLAEMLAYQADLERVK